MNTRTPSQRSAFHRHWAAGVLAASLWLLGPILALAQPRAYITNEKSDDVTVIDTTADTVVATIKVGKQPRGIVIAPDGKRAYTANGNSNDISVIDLHKNTVIGKLPAGIDPEGMAISRDGKRLYVVNENGGEVVVVDLAAKKLRQHIPVGTEPETVVLSPLCLALRPVVDTTSNRAAKCKAEN